MKRALLIHYHFLPVHNVGVKHLLGLARHLPAWGWRATVLTKEWKQIRPTDAPWGLSWDADLEASLSATLSIERVAEPATRRIRLPRRSDPFLVRRALTAAHLLAGHYPDVFAGWVPAAVDAAIRLHRQCRFDAVSSYCPPETNVVAGSRVARALRIPFVVYFGDLYGFHLRPRSLLVPGSQLQSSTRRRWMAPATGAAAVSPAMRSYVERTFDVPTELVLVGFDEEEFATPLARPAGRHLRLSHVGSIYPGPQRPEVFLDGLDAFLGAHPNAVEAVRVDFIGSKCDEALRQMLSARACRRVCEVRPRVDARQAVEAVRSSDALLAFTLIERHGLGTLSFPSKIFEAFAAQRPVLVVPSDGDFVDHLLRECRGGQTADDAAGVATVLAGWFREWQRHGRLASEVRTEVVAGYSRRTQARRFASVLDRAERGQGRHDGGDVGR